MPRSLRLTDALQYRLAFARRAADQGDPVAVTQAKVDLADAVLAADDRATSRRVARLAGIQPTPLVVRLTARRGRRRA